MPRDRPYQDPSGFQFPATFGFGQWSLIRLAGWIRTYDPPFFTAAGGQILIDNSGQVSGPYELLQLQQDKIVANWMTKNIDATNAEVKSLGLGFTSESDPNYFVPYWSRSNDVEIIQAGLLAGAGLEDARTSALNAGWDDSALPDVLLEAACVGAGHHVVNYWPSIDGITSYGNLAQVLRSNWAFYFRDPVMFIDQTTGELSPDTTLWAYHIGGEKINLAVRAPMDAGSVGAISYVLRSIEVFFDPQSAAILYGLTPAFLNKFNDVLKLGQSITQDEVGPIPVSPDMKKYLSAGSKFNSYKVTPPTFGDSWIFTMFSGVNPLVLTGTPNSTPVTWEGKTSALARNDLFLTEVPGVLASRMKSWLDADKGRLFPPPTDRTLQLIAMPK